MDIKKMEASGFTEFNMADYIESPEDIEYYLQDVLNEGDISELAYSLGVIAKSKGMSKVAVQSGLQRESLYKSLRKDATPRFDTINKVLNSLGFKLSIQKC